MVRVYPKHEELYLMITALGRLRTTSLDNHWFLFKYFFENLIYEYCIPMCPSPPQLLQCPPHTCPLSVMASSSLPLLGGEEGERIYQVHLVLFMCACV